MLTYDASVYLEFREKAITKKEDLKLGQTYFANTDPKQFRLLKLISYRDAYARDGHGWDESCKAYESGHEIGWALIEFWSEYHHRMVISTMSLKDRNVGASYNPWLIFENEADRDAYVDQIAIRLESDGWE